MFDDYAATMPLIIVVLFELVAVAWFYGVDRFFDDIQEMIGRRPFFLYKYMWKFVCPIIMVALLLASLIRMCINHPTYRAWNQTKAEEVLLEYPDWALAMMILLIVMACLPIPLMYIRQALLDRQLSRTDYSECAYIGADGVSFPLDGNASEGVGQNGYLKVETEEGGLERSVLLSEEEEEEEEEEEQEEVIEMDDLSQEQSCKAVLK
ncbi:sodium-dependent neutral amino acid transporter B(0)AT2-like [Amblyraja radiata]|uniref:sodium-dependent neutral amino acid transporter B(0)AT2-like n=1 Tax=Amblyraja radiata TaxID=386614 RepID=UPI001402A1ED|nr:sodium-dependent neutral amino acid transporter B(0)AT2-like [Amblyraja radiata]